MSKEFNEQKMKAELGQIIKSRRKQKKLTQEELSEIVGITDVYLRDLERGVYTATWIIWLRICTALDIDLKYIQEKYIVPELTKEKISVGEKKI